MRAMRSMETRASTNGSNIPTTATGKKLTETNMNDCVSNYIYGDFWGNLSQVIQDPHVTANDSHLARTITMLYDVSGRVLQSTDPAIQTAPSSTTTSVSQRAPRSL